MIGIFVYAALKPDLIVVFDRLQTEDLPTLPIKVDRAIKVTTKSCSLRVVKRFCRTSIGSVGYASENGANPPYIKTWRLGGSK
jgi:hypothetical protein